MKFPSFVRLFGERWSRNSSSRKRGKVRRSPAARSPRLGVEALEERTLMSVLPPPTFTSHLDISNSRGNESNPSVAVDPVNPSRAVAVYTRNDPQLAPGPQVISEGRYTVNGGATWSTFFLQSPLSNPATTNPTIPFAQETDPSVGFDRNGNFYITTSQHSADLAVGAIVMQKFSFSGSSPVQVDLDPTSFRNQKLLYQWQNSVDRVFNPTMAVDSNLGVFTDPDTGATQNDANAGNVYVAWSTALTPFTNAPTSFNPNRIQLLASSDGGFSFSAPIQVSGTDFGSAREAYPRLAISQGSANVPAGQVTVVWDDFGTGATATPIPFDLIRSNTVSADGPTSSAQYTGTGGGVADAINPGSGSHIPQTTSFPIFVNITDPDFNFVTDLDVTLNLTHPGLGELFIQLTPPATTGLAPITLLFNQTNADGTTNPPGFGVTGANLGTLNGFALGTTFDDQAVRAITDASAAAPFIGHFRPNFGPLSLVNGLTPAQINGLWTLDITDNRNGNVGNLINWSMNFTAGQTVGFENFVASTTVRGAVPGTAFPNVPAAAPVTGIGPLPVIASDNTLGSFNPNSGRLYVAYVDRFVTPTGVVPQNPADNTDIFLAYSDDGGFTWISTGLPINDDVATNDGFSEGSIAQSGRAQYAPAIAVDPLTGTLVVSWYDARNDAARSRVATYLATSIDGGTTFAPQVYANRPVAPVDAITGKVVDVGPIPDNPGQNRDATFGFGLRQGLAVAGGRIYPVWSGNLNGGNNTQVQQEILTGPAVTAAGPRIVSSTQGPVISDLTAGGFSANDTFASDGTRQLNGFLVTFDRPVDVNTFDMTDVTVRYRSPNTPGSAPGTVIPVQSVTPIGNTTQFAATQFLVTLTPQSAVGTYSYSIGPNIRDLVRSITTQVTTLATNTFAAPPSQVNKPIPPVGTGGSANPADNTTTSTIIVSSIPAGQTVTAAQVTLSLTHTFDFDLVITLIAPDGTRVLLSQNEGGSGDNYTNTNFNDNAPLPISAGNPPFTGSFRPEMPLSTLIGKNANGTWTLEIVDQFFFDSGVLQAWSLTLQTGIVATQVSTGNLMDQNANALPGEDPALTNLAPGDVYAVPAPTGTTLFNGTSFTPPFAPDTLPLIVPGPHVIATRVPNNAKTDDNLILGAVKVENSNALTIPANTTVVSPLNIADDDNFTIVSAILQFDATFPRDGDLVISLVAPDGTTVVLVNGRGGAGANFSNTTFDDAVTTPIANGIAPFASRFLPETPLAALIGKNSKGSYQLQIRNTGTSTGTLNGWSLTLRKSAVVDAIDVTFDRDMDPATFTAADIVRILGPNGVINPQPTYAAVNLPQPIPDNVVVGGQPTALVSSLTINDAFTISDLNVTLNLTHPRDGDLKVELQGPDGTRITLFDGVGGTGANFTNTVLDDQAATTIGAAGTAAPFTGSFRPVQLLSTFNGKTVTGTWRLIVTDATSGSAGQLTGWSLTTQSITGNPNATDPDPTRPRTFRIGFPRQFLSGTYTISLGSDIRSANGEALDSNLNAGLDAVRGQSPGGVDVPVTATSTDVPQNIQDAAIVNGQTITKTIVSTLNVTDDFPLDGLTLRLNITHTNDPDLTAVLVAPDGTRVLLFDRVGNTGSRANFNNTVFDDFATTPIQNGGPPFQGTFNPATPLTALKGKSTKGIWRLEITDNTPGNTGRLNSWSITFQKPVPGTNLGEPVADRATVSFRIFNMDITNPVAFQNWTSVGPAAIGASASLIPGAEGEGNGGSGRIGGIALDPSDPSGNTVFIAGASGGVWKTTNFLTTDPEGPVYVPLTDFGPTFGINIGGLAVFGRNNDPNQSIIFAATGEGDVASTGVGFLRSMDGGATWTILDSTTNVDAAGNILPISSPLRDHIFLGTTSFKVVVDPRPTPAGEAIVYAAISGTNGGLWRSLDTGKTWQLMRAGQATDLVLDPSSGTFNAISNPTGNLQIVYAGFRGEGVFSSPNRGQVWNLMAGGVGKPFFQDGNIFPTSRIPVNNPSDTPNGAKGRIVLAKPELTGNPAQDLQYAGWLWVGTVATSGNVNGLYLTKDFGQNWTRVRTPTLPPVLGAIRAVPSNDPANADYDVGGGANFTQGNYDISLTVDPLNPNVVYFGGTADGQPTGLIRVDATGLHDPNAFFLGNDGPGGALRGNTTSPVTLKNAQTPPPVLGYSPFPLNPVTQPYVNLIRHPSSPFVSNTTFYASNTANIANDGTDARWIPFDFGPGISSSTDYHRSVALRDPISGRTRLIFGNDQGVYTLVDRGDGTLVQSLGDVESAADDAGNVRVPNGSRNGNLQITQFYYGASQPSELAAQLSELRTGPAGMFFGEAQDDGNPSGNADILSNGEITWEPNGGGDGGGVATDQTGTGTVFEYLWPCCGGNNTDFFKVNGIGRTFGLIEQSNPGPTPDPQWPFTGVLNFAVNPLRGGADNAQIIIGSAGIDFGVATGGNVFSTFNAGLSWSKIGTPAAFGNDGTTKMAFAYGAPQPGDPTGSVNNFLYVGSNGGRIFVTFTGGGNQQNAWKEISTGLDGTSVRAIVTNPARGSREAFAVTDQGVFYLQDAGAASPTWQNITGNLFSVMHDSFGITAFREAQLRYLETIQADWRYVIPDSAGEIVNPISPPGASHPILYVAGEGGVYRSLDKGTTWALFPSNALEGGATGGNLPNAHVTDLDIALGNINPTTGRPDTANGPNILLASTYGRGSFAIRLAPLVFAQSLRLDPNLPAPRGSDTGVSPTDKITSELRPFIDGLSLQSAFGNTVRIDLIDLTPNSPTFNQIIGTGVTDANGRFQVQVNAGVFLPDGTTDGLRTIGVRATDGSGTTGPIVNFTFTIDTTPLIIQNSVLLDPANPTTPQGEPPQIGSDSGKSTSDRITLVTTPVFIGRVDQAAPVTVQVFDTTNAASPILLGTTTTDASGFFRVFTSPGIYQSNGSTDGVKTITVRASNATKTSQLIFVNFFTLDTTKPAAPTLNLSPISDSGSSNTDHITNITQPTFTGTGEPGAEIRIFAQLAGGPNTRIATGTVDATGNYSVSSNALTAGTYTITALQVDVAGNVGNPSSALAPPLMIVTQLPTPATIALDPASDTGRPGDNITAAVPQDYNGTNQAGVTLTVKDNGIAIGPFDTTRLNVPQQYKVGGIVVATYVQLSATTFRLTWSLGDGNHSITVMETDTAGNMSTSSPPLVVTVDRDALDNDRKFVRSIYATELGRPGVLAEWNTWVPLLSQPDGRRLVANGIARSQEARTFLVTNWYMTFLGRQADFPGAQGWVNALLNGQTEEQVLSQILASQEFFLKAPNVPNVGGGPATPTTFVRALYQLLLNRQPSQAEINSWLPTAGSNRQLVAASFLGSREYRQIVVVGYYKNLLKRPAGSPGQTEVDSWTLSGLDITSIRVGFLASQEYFNVISGFRNS